MRINKIFASFVSFYRNYYYRNGGYDSVDNSDKIIEMCVLLL